jgi:hypothetical protein
LPQNPPHQPLHVLPLHLHLLRCFMNRDHQEKLARVNAWLRSTFDGDRVPAFQATEANVERLYALCIACEQVAWA